MNMQKNTQDAVCQTNLQPSRKERIHIRHKHNQDTGNYKYTRTYIRAHIHTYTYM